MPVRHSVTGEQCNRTWKVHRPRVRVAEQAGRVYRRHIPTPLAVLAQCSRVQKTSILGPLLVVVRAQVNHNSNNSSSNYHKEEEGEEQGQ